MARRYPVGLQGLDEDLASLAPAPSDELAQRVRAAVEQADPEHPERTGAWAYLGKTVSVAAATLVCLTVLIFMIVELGAPRHRGPTPRSSPPPVPPSSTTARPGG